MVKGIDHFVQIVFDAIKPGINIIQLAIDVIEIMVFHNVSPVIKVPTTLDTERRIAYFYGKGKLYILIVLMKKSDQRIKRQAGE